MDSWRDESSEAIGVSSQTTSEAIAGANARWNTPPAPTSQRHLSAEYPFHKNLCMPPQGINFDITHKRGEYLVFFCKGASHKVLQNFFFFYFHIQMIFLKIYQEKIRKPFQLNFEIMESYKYRIYISCMFLNPNNFFQFEL